MNTIQDLKTNLTGRLMKPSSDQKYGLIIEVVIGAIIGWIIQRCLDDIFPRDARSPNILQRIRLRFAVAKAVRDNVSSEESQMFGGRQQLVNDICDHLLDIGSSMTDEQFYSIKANANEIR